MDKKIGLKIAASLLTKHYPTNVRYDRYMEDSDQDKLTALVYEMEQKEAATIKSVELTINRSLFTNKIEVWVRYVAGDEEFCTIKRPILNRLFRKILKKFEDSLKQERQLSEYKKRKERGDKLILGLKNSKEFSNLLS